VLILATRTLTVGSAWKLKRNVRPLNHMTADNHYGSCKAMEAAVAVDLLGKEYSVLICCTEKDGAPHRILGSLTKPM